MTRFVIDPSALLQLVDSGRAVAPEHQLVAPNSVRSDAMTLLLRQVAGGELTESAALQLHERMTELKIRLLGDRVSRRTAWRIAREHDFDSMRSAEFVAIARLQADALIAGDAELLEKARDLVPLASLAEVFAP